MSNFVSNGNILYGKDQFKAKPKRGDKLGVKIQLCLLLTSKLPDLLRRNENKPDRVHVELGRTIFAFPLAEAKIFSANNWTKLFPNFSARQYMFVIFYFLAYLFSF